MITPSRRIKKILAAIDFSVFSKKTLEYAYEVSEISGTELLVVNIINQREIDSKKEIMNVKNPDAFSIATYLPKEISRRRLKFEALVTRCGFDKRPSIKMIVDYGVPVEKILQVTDEEGVDLLIIGPKGRTNLHNFLFGAVAEKLFRHSTAPVMSLRFPIEQKSLNF